MKDFKIRCSCIGKIMTNPRSKSETISKTTITYLEEWVKEQIYGRKKEISSKYLDKGLIVEDNSLDLAADYLDLGFAFKNEEYFENDFLTGTPDVVQDDEVIDIKSSWDCFTFPLFEKEIPTKDYYYQLQGYMALTGKETARLVYVLTDTPDHLIEREATFTCKGEDFEEHLQKTRERMTYGDIDNSLKVKAFDVIRDEEVISKIYDRVKDCREYLKTVKIPQPLIKTIS